MTRRSLTGGLWGLLLQILSGRWSEVATADDDADNRWQIDPDG